MLLAARGLAGPWSRDKVVPRGALIRLHRDPVARDDLLLPAIFEINVSRDALTLSLRRKGIVNAIKRFFDSTIGQKVLVAVTGLALVGFLITHLAGNLLMYTGDDGEAFNAYSAGLHDLGALLYVAEIGLLVIFLAHVGLVARLVLAQRSAGGGGRYAVRSSKRGGGLSLLSSKMMAISGIVVLTFIVVHIWDFRLQLEPDTDLFQMVKTALKEPWRVGLYTAGSFLIGWHVFHGFQSAFRSMGLNHSTFTPALEKAGKGLAVLFGLGFASFPLWIFFTQ
jgi:succinate dehydrogenase / fumarate reductase, cytochrome b subunit